MSADTAGPKRFGFEFLYVIEHKVAHSRYWAFSEAFYKLADARRERNLYEHSEINRRVKFRLSTFKRISTQ
jgi:hypothetical protein